MGKSLKYGEFTFSSDPVGGSKGYARGGKIQPGSPAANAGPGRVTNMGPGNMPGRGNLPPGNMPRVEVAPQQRLPPGNMPRPAGVNTLGGILGAPGAGPQTQSALQSASRSSPSNLPTQVAQKVGAAMRETQSRVADYRNKIGQAMGTRASPMPGGPGGGRPMPPVSLPPPVPPKAPQMKSGGKVNIPSPKSDMLYSKKEVNAKNLLSEGKAPNLPHAKGSVNMAKGGMTPKQQAKVGKVMGEFKAGELHSGSKTGPVVKNRKQAVAIGLSEARKAGKK